MQVKDQHIEDIRASILFQDEYFLAINKPSGVSVQGGSKVKFHIAGLLPYLQFDAEEPPRLVHRLDQVNTSFLPSCIILPPSVIPLFVIEYLSHHSLFFLGNKWCVILGSNTKGSKGIHSTNEKKTSHESLLGDCCWNS
jgi:hypothetical protein